MGFAVIVSKLFLLGQNLPNPLKENLLFRIDYAVLTIIVNKRDSALTGIRQPIVCLISGFERFGKIQHAAPHPDNGTGSEQIVGVLVEQFEFYPLRFFTT